MSINKQEISLTDIAKVFVTIGTIGFGGGMAIIALIQDYCVNRRKWINSDEFAHGVALGQFLGPFAVNASIFVGYRLRGLRGAVVALTSFLAPSIILVIAISALYMQYHHIPSLQSALRGIGPVVIALILSAAYQMGGKKIRSFEPIFLALAAIGLSILLKLPVIVIIVIAIGYGFLKVAVLRMRGNI